MHYILQADIYEEKYTHFIELLERFKLPYILVRIFAFSDKIVQADLVPYDFDVDDLPDFTPPEKIIVFGSIKLGRLALEKWGKGIYWNYNHDYQIYAPHYQDNLLNFDSQVLPFEHSPQEWKYDQMFVRPCLDNKLFNGKRYSRLEYQDLLEHNKKEVSKNSHQFVQVASIKNIYEEIRFFVVKGKVITGSRYILNKKFSTWSHYDQEAHDFAQRMVDLYQVSDAFVIDVCLTDEGWKIVEINSFNGAGLYEIDVFKLIDAIETYL
jgi:hypothetical protein